MFALLFVTVVEYAIVAGVLVAGYNIFLSDIIKAHRQKTVESKARFDSADKIAKVKLVSMDQKDIEQFITANAQYLSDSVIDQLVSRIEYLQADQSIAEDNLLKKRISDLKQPEEGPEEEESHAKSSRS